MTRDADVVVLGAGVVGLAAAAACARAGHSVLVLERDVPGGPGGSSHGRSRIFRLGYPEAGWVRLALEAEALWRALESVSGEQLLVPLGSLDVGPSAPAVAEALAACGVAHEVLDGAAASARWPLRFAAGETVVHQPGAGIVRADRTLAVLRARLDAAGGELRCRTPVTQLAAEGDAVRVATPGGEVVAGAAIVAAGAWAPALLAEAGIALAAEPTRETVLYVADPAAESLPSLIDYASTAGTVDGLPRDAVAGYALAAPGVGLKAGLHHSGPVVDPDTPPAPDPRVVEWASAWVARRFRLDGPPSVETCIYTTTPDEEFVLRREGRIVVGSACSGHGFKFAPLVGHRLAALAGEALAA